MTFSLLSRNYFIRSSITKVQLVFIKTNKSINPLGSNLKRTETKVVPIDKYYKML